MVEVIVAPQARTDLASIIDRLATVASPTTARKWNDRLWQTIEGLGEMPGSGAPRHKLGLHVRINIVKPYIIIYEHVRDSGRVDVLRVLHGRRRITRKLLQEAS